MRIIRTTFAPDFYVVGAAKAGTTAVWSWLRDHPDVFLPAIKEPGYFAFADGTATPRSGLYDPSYISCTTTDIADYSRLYAGSGDRLTGDVSPVYLIDECAAARIASARPDARIVVLLRDPVARAFSQFLHHVRDCLEPCRTFEAALAAESERLQDGWSWGHGYATHGHYASQIERYLSVFSTEQILFLEYRCLQENPEECWRRLCVHLGLEPCPMFRNERVNATATLGTVPARPSMSRALQHPGPVQTILKDLIPPRVRAKLRKSLEGNGRERPTLREATRHELARRYHQERASIELWTGLSLAHWAG